MHKGCKICYILWPFWQCRPQVCIEYIKNKLNSGCGGASHTPGQGGKSNVSVTGNLGGKVGPVVAEATVGGSKR